MTDYVAMYLIARRWLTVSARPVISVNLLSWRSETRSCCHFIPSCKFGIISITRISRNKKANSVLLYLRGLNSPAIFFTIGIADGGISLFFNFLLFGLLAADNGGIDSVYSRIHWPGTEETRSSKTRTITSLEHYFSLHLRGRQRR